MNVWNIPKKRAGLHQTTRNYRIGRKIAVAGDPSFAKPIDFTWYSGSNRR